MTTSIAEYYITELNDWTNSLNFHLEEMEASQERLDEILHLNSVPDLAASVEHYLNQLFFIEAKPGEFKNPHSYPGTKIT